MKFISLVFLIIFSVSNSFALESDQYLVWGKELKDISDSVNAHVNSTIEKAIEEINQSKRKSKKYDCHDVRRYSLEKFRGFVIHKIEHWIEDHLGEELYPAANVGFPKYFKMSIYNWEYSGIARLFPMGRNMNLGGVYLGADKLAHFFSTGMRYYEIYAKAKKKGASEEEARIKAIKYGIFTERTILGLWPSGVYSFGDLEANYQGLTMNKQFCEGENPRVQKIDGSWKLVRKVDLKEFVNPLWDETFNPSYFGALKWLKVKRMLKKRYCHRMDDEAVKERMQRYSQMKFEESFSVKYLSQRQKNGDRKVPDVKPQELAEICKKN